MSALRLTCLVPFCNHTRGQRKGEEPIQAGEEWICGAHWKGVAGATRRAWRIAARAYGKHFDQHGIFWRLKPGSPERCAAVDLRNAHDLAWDRCKAEAIESAAGIAA